MAFHIFVTKCRFICTTPGVVIAASESVT
jgi:hypothetical protein